MFFLVNIIYDRKLFYNKPITNFDNTFNVVQAYSYFFKFNSNLY